MNDDEDDKATHKLHDLFSALRDEIARVVPAGRERSLASTKLDECGMWLFQATEGRRE